MQGKLDIYPNWGTFAIEDIVHPIMGDAYISQLDDVIVGKDYKKKTMDTVTGKKRYRFIGGSEPFDPITRGFDTWDHTYELSHPDDVNRNFYFAILLDSKTLKNISNRFRNDHVEVFGNFLERVAKIDIRVKDFLDYSYQWAQKQASQTKR